MGCSMRERAEMREQQANATMDEEYRILWNHGGPMFVAFKGNPCP